MIDFDTPITTKQSERTATGGPNIPPRAVLPTTLPKVHHVVRWHNDARLTKSAHETKEKAFEFARASHWATIWKWAVMDGRDIIARQLVCEPTEV
jgi:hypothetical protein